ncbi:MAG: trypsin-like peptidase domain-containing protein [bacterium]|nr:trypsin-like peptidase domain-containing protein [bacterium]
MRNLKKILSARMSSSVIIFSLSAIVAGGFYALAAGKYNEYSFRKAQKENQIQNILIAQQNSLNEIKKEIDLLKQKDEETRLSTTKLIISAQKIEDKINDSENETKIKEENSQRKILEIEDKISGLSNETSIVVKEWRPRVARIVCQWQYSNGLTRLIKNGSGFVFGEDASVYGGIWTLTNKHVFLDDNGQPPSTCSIKLPENDKTFQAPFVYGSYKTFSSVDMGLIEIKDSNSQLSAIVSSEKEIFCQYNADIGEKMAILGYPSIGSVNDVTATEGIVSGHEGDYYVTSAKIEFGNSGGIAVSTKNNCVLGIPTFVKAGQIETLGRVLSTEAMFEAWGISF